MGILGATDDDATMKLQKQQVLSAAAAFCTAIALAVVLLPTGVVAAGSTFVKLQDYKSKSNSGKASVVGNRLLVGDGDGPLTVDGTVGVSGPVAVTGNVGVTGPVAVTGNVGVTGPVTVQGSVTSSAPAVQPLTLKCEVINSTTDGGSGCVMNVPAGQRFVVQTVTMAVTVNAGLRASAYFQFNTGGTNAQMSVPLVYQTTIAGGTKDLFVATSPSMTLYPDVGGAIGANFSRIGTTGFSGSAVLTGYVE